MAQDKVKESVGGHVLADQIQLIQVNQIKKTAANGDSLACSILGVTSTASARAVSLKSADCFKGNIMVVKDESGAAGTNNITISTEGSELIDGAATSVISANYGYKRMYSDGANWFLI